MSHPAALLQTWNLGVEVASTRICDGLGLTVRPGERWALLGPNGVGKTTLLHTLAGLRRPREGGIRLLDQSLGQMPRRRAARLLGLLPQHHEDAFPASVLATALIGRHPHLAGWRWESEVDLILARRALDDVGLSGLESRMVHSLSGGERRRLGLATLLTQDPDVLLLDEPTNHLDVGHQVMLLEGLARRVAQQGKAWIMVTHDINLAARFCDRAVLLFGGGQFAQGESAALLDETHLSRLYAHPMCRLNGPWGPVFVPR